MTTKIEHHKVKVPHHEVQLLDNPSWSSHASDWILLSIVALGDAIQFMVVVKRAEPQAGPEIVSFLVAALTAAAVLLMHNAGAAYRRHKAGSSSSETVAHGRGPALVMIMFWFSMGLAAAVLRITAKTPAPSSDSFGQTVVVESGQNNVQMAFLMLFLYLAGGAVAYYIGFKNHNPNLTAAKQARRNLQTERNRHEVEMERLAALRDAATADLATAKSRLAGLAEQSEHLEDDVEMLTAELREIRTNARLNSIRQRLADEHSKHLDQVKFLEELRASTSDRLGAAISQMHFLQRQEELLDVILGLDVVDLKCFPRDKVAQKLKNPASTDGIFRRRTTN